MAAVRIQHNQQIVELNQSVSLHIPHGSQPLDNPHKIPMGRDVQHLDRIGAPCHHPTTKPAAHLKMFHQATR